MVARAGILIVEDQSIVARDIERQVQDIGYEPLGIASTGEDAIALAATLRPQLVLMDVHLAGALDGIDAAVAIRAQCGIPCVFVTAFSTDEMVERAKRAEPLGYVVKPFDEPRLRAAIEIALHKDHLDRQLRESEARYRAVVDSAHDAIVTADAEGNIAGWSPSASVIFGYSEREILGQPLTMLMPASMADAHRTGVRPAQSADVLRTFSGTREWVGRRKDGCEFPLELSLARWETEEGWFVTGMVRDVTTRKRAEDAARQSELRLHLALDSAQMGIWDLDLVTDTAFRTPRHDQIFGYDALQPEWGAAIFFTHVVPDDREAVRRRFDEAFATGHLEFECRIRWPDQSTHWISVKGHAPRNGGEQPVRMMGTIVDVTDRKRAEQKERNASVYARSLIEASLDPLVTISPAGTITDVNHATEAATGVARDDLVGSDFGGYFAEPDRARAGYEQALAQGTVRDYPLTLRSTSGQTIDVLYNASVYRDETGAVLGVFAAARDVTERNKAEAALRESEALLQAVLRILPVGLWVSDETGTLIYGNDAGEQIWAGSRFVGVEQYGEYKGWWLDSGAPLGPHDWGMARALEKGEISVEEEVEIECFDGTHKIIVNSALPLRRSDGSISGVIGVNQDITGRKRAEEALRRSEHRYRLLIESAPVCIHEIGLDGRISSMNRAGLAMMGVQEECKVQGAFYLDVVCAADRERIGALLARAYSGEASNFEFKASGPDGPIFKSCFVPIKNRDGCVDKLMGIAEDITQRKRADDLIKEKEERLALATINNGVGVWDWNLRTQEMIWDDSMYALYHIRREDFSGTEEAWRAALHPGDLARGDQEVEDAISGKKPFDTAFRVIWPNGEVRYIKAVAKVFRDDQGTPVRMLGINMDVSDRGGSKWNGAS